MRTFVVISSMVLLGFPSCIFSSLDVEGKTCTSTEPCPRNLVCILGGSGEGICRRPSSTCPGETRACERSQGVCAGKTRQCLAQEPELVCTALSYGSTYETVESRCDGLDNDCDGLIDLIPDGGAILGSNCQLTQGVCLGARQACVTGTFEQVCSAGSYGPLYDVVEQRCDGLDNDCDGTVDASKLVDLTEDMRNFDWVSVDGGFLAAYENPFESQPRQVYLRRFNPQLSPVAEPKSVPISDGVAGQAFAHRPRLLAAHGRIYVAWFEPGTNTSDANLFLRAATEDGDWLNAGPRTGAVASAPQFFGPPSITATPSGVALGWVQFVSTDIQFRAVILDADGVSISSAATLSALNVKIATETRIADFAFLRRGGFLAAWAENGLLHWQSLDSRLSALPERGTFTFNGPVSEVIVRETDVGEPLVAAFVNEATNAFVTVMRGPLMAAERIPVAGSGTALLSATALQGGDFWVAGARRNAVWGVVLHRDGKLGTTVTVLADAGTPITSLAVAGTSQPAAVAMTRKENQNPLAPRIAGGRFCAP